MIHFNLNFFFLQRDRAQIIWEEYLEDEKKLDERVHNDPVNLLIEDMLDLLGVSDRVVQPGSYNGFFCRHLVKFGVFEETRDGVFRLTPEWEGRVL